MGSDAAEFVDRVKDQVRSRQKRMSNIAESGEEHLIIWGMFMAATMNAATFMGQNFSTIQSVFKNHESLTLKQMFDVTAQLVNNQEEINGLDKILWGKNSWTRLSLIDDEIVINLQRTKVYVFSDSVLCLGRWKACLAAGGGSKRRFQYCSYNFGTIIYFRALQGHSGNNLIDPTLQDNVLIGTEIFPYIYHVGCTFSLHSIINNGLVPGGQILSRRQTVFFLPVDPRDESHRDPECIDLSVPRLARYVHSAWKRHQDAVFWVDIDLAIKEGLTFYQTRSNAIILQGTLPAYCIPKVERLKTGEVLYERPYLSPRPPPKIYLIKTRSRLDQRE